MNIYDCFMYFDEDLLLDLRLNTLDKYVKKFVITEATYTHNGNKTQEIHKCYVLYLYVCVCVCV